MNDSESIASIKAYIDSHYDSAITIGQLARLACMSPGKLKYCFKAELGHTVYGYLTDVRMRCAEGLLANTDLGIAHIAERVGYKKPGAFAAAFRKRTGRLPKDVRKSRSVPSGK